MDRPADLPAPKCRRLPIAREGIPFIAVPGGIGVYLLALGFQSAALFTFFLTAFIVFFFRDPERKVPEADDSVLSPADGKVVSVAMVRDETTRFEEMLKVSVFMSVFNVHVNRIPADGTVSTVSYHPGKFLSAHLDKASLDNERNAVYMNLDDGKTLVVVQVAGLIARRIVCKVQRGERVKRGERFGLIRFGSRLDVYLPPGTQPAVSVGEKVIAGVSRLGFLK